VETAWTARVLSALDEHDVALVSDAGTPTLSDPGQALVEAAWAAGHTVVPIPGPSAITAALSVAGYGGRIHVPGLPASQNPGEIRRLLATIAGDPRPAVAFESPYRVHKSLAIVAEVLPERQAHRWPRAHKAPRAGLAWNRRRGSSPLSASARAASYCCDLGV